MAHTEESWGDKLDLILCLTQETIYKLSKMIYWQNSVVNGVLVVIIL
jgi:hypothetical protein